MNYENRVRNAMVHLLAIMDEAGDTAGDKRQISEVCHEIISQWHADLTKAVEGE